MAKEGCELIRLEHPLVMTSKPLNSTYLRLDGGLWLIMHRSTAAYRLEDGGG